jgi:hypothetical protein
MDKKMPNSEVPSPRSTVELWEKKVRYLWCHPIGCAYKAVGRTSNTCGAEIRQLDVACIGEQDVPGFNIPETQTVLVRNQKYNVVDPERVNPDPCLIHSSHSRPALKKGTALRDRFWKCWRKLTDLGLNKGRGWFFEFFGGTLVFSWNKTSSFW